MIYLAGMHYGNAFVEGFNDKPWGHIALIFFIGEIASVTLMGWLVRQVASTWNGNISYRNAYLLAAIAAIPVWLSSLGLLVPSLSFNAVVSVMALSLSCGLVYHGVRAFCQIREELQAAAITQIVFGTGLLLWAVLLMFVVVMPT